MITVLYILLGIVVVTALAIKIFIARQGDARLVIHYDERTPMAVEDMTGDKVVLSSHIEFSNTGTQDSVITDLFARTLLPFEQYDGIDARGKVERLDAPREDDYFEAYIIEPGCSMIANVKITLTARKGMTIQEALSRMVDLPTELFFTTMSRRPPELCKHRVVFSAEEIARAADVELVED